VARLGGHLELLPCDVGSRSPFDFELHRLVAIKPDSQVCPTNGGDKLTSRMFPTKVGLDDLHGAPADLVATLAYRKAPIDVRELVLAYLHAKSVHHLYRALSAAIRLQTSRSVPKLAQR
jgi:hypothetical protein